MHMPHLEQAYQYCQSVVAGHYENFPVASRLLPAKLRRPISVIYTFARTADDFADEGVLNKTQRHQKLDDYRQKLSIITKGGIIDDPVFIALVDVIKCHTLPYSLFYDLITAFKMDVDKTCFTNFAEILNYCHYSANPIGRLLLYLHGAATPENLSQADAICSALQLINFYQDLTQDYNEHGRIYLPEDEMHQFGVTENHIEQMRSDEAMQELMNIQFRRAATMLQYGYPLGNAIKGRFGFELRMIIQGGACVLDKLQAHTGNVFRRPRLNKWNALRITVKALLRLSV